MMPSFALRPKTQCAPRPLLPCQGNCSYSIVQLKSELPESVCCDGFLPDVMPVEPFTSVEDSIEIVLSGHGFAKISEERSSRKEFGRQNSSTFTLSIEASPLATQGQWVLIDRMGISDHGQIVSIDRTRLGWMKLTVDTEKVLPFDRLAVRSPVHPTVH